MHGNLLAAFLRQFQQRFLSHGEHPARAAGPIVQQVGTVGNLIGDGFEDEAGHQADGITRSPVLTCFLVVFFVEAAHQFLEDRTHGVIVEAGQSDSSVAIEHGLRAQVDGRVEKLLDERAQGIGFGKTGDLVAELEVVDDFLHVGREAVEISAKIGLQLLAVGPCLEVPERERGGVVKGLAGGPSQSSVLVYDPLFVEQGFHGEHFLLGGFEHCIEPTDHGHRQDDVAVLAAHVKVAQHVVRDTPDEIGDPSELAVFHCKGSS
ncbi:hypothetical protein HRbin30_00750 [bacterium HR30]|nr:hypothetical protein HRbin30_00750 [bacterium HR30]